MTLAPKSTAVMAQRAPGSVDSDDELTALYRQLDYFPTPPWAARAGAELIQRLDPAAASVWECACGAGHMAEPLLEYFSVFASDVHPHGYGEVIDFLSDDADAVRDDIDWIVTNKPFKPAGDFLTRALRRARRGVALLLRVQFLEGVGRYPLLYGSEPMTAFAPFSERVPMVLGKWDPEASTATAYAWFLWMKGAEPMPVQPIGPGTRDRLWRADDAARFGAKGDAPLLSMMGERC
jgi:hypothetical protein